MSSSLLRHFVVPLAVMMIGVTLFIASVSTRTHHRACQESCSANGQRYERGFAFAPFYAPPCQCIGKDAKELSGRQSVKPGRAGE
jgi:hypothetical protein